MLIDGQKRTAIWPDPEGRGVFIIDQTRLPHVVATVLLATSTTRRGRSGTCWCAARR